MVEDRSRGARLFDVGNHLLLALLALVCLMPLIHVTAVSFSDRAAVSSNVVTFWPVNFNTVNYERILEDAQFGRSLVVSVVRTVGGTALTMLVIVLTAYPLAHSRGFTGRKIVVWLLIFAMLFDGGLIPLYLAIRGLGMLDTIWALILPGMVNVFYILVMVNFFRALPHELSDAAMIDGASHWTILFRIFVPLSVPALATLTLFIAVEHWNAWFDALIFMRTPNNYPLQTYLQTTVVAGDFSGLMANSRTVTQMSQRALRSAQIILTTLPILAIYPFVQRYFVRGLIIGSVKG